MKRFKVDSILKFTIMAIISLNSLEVYSEGGIDRINLTDRELTQWLDFLEYACTQDPTCDPLHFDDSAVCDDDGPCGEDAPHELTVTDFGGTCHYYIREYFTNEEGECCWISHSYSGDCYEE